MAVTQNSLVLLAASAAAELLVRGRWELVHKRALRGYYAPEPRRLAIPKRIAEGFI